jgi:hypothetical protein
MGAAFDRLTAALEAHGYKVKTQGRDRARSACPGHGGDDLNLSIAVGDQGVLVKCMSYDCPAEDIAKAVGLTLPDLFDKEGRAVYDYGGGHRVTRKRTRDGKQIFQQNKPSTTALYRHPDSEPIEEWGGYVTLVEGEKCVDAAIRLGERCATTWPGGADGVDQVDLTPLMGKNVRIIADNDKPGLRAAGRLASRLAGIAAVEGVWIIPNEKESVDDLWIRGGTLEELVGIPVPFEPSEPAEQPARGLALTGLDAISSKRTRFLWEKMIPQSAVTISAGRGGTGKSTFWLWLAGRITRGELPGELHGEPQSVLYVSHEDSPEEVVAPRADANDVDRSRFHLLGIQSKEVGGVTVPRLPEDMPIIRQAIAQTGAKLLIIDPITSTLGGGDNDKMADVRMVMDPLNAMAAELGVSVVGIAHFRKGGGNQADLISGSHAWRDAARCVMLFARDEEEDCTVMTLEKINSGEAGKSFRYRLDIVQQMTDEGLPTDVGRIVWEGDSVQSVGDLINHETARQNQGNLANDILEYLRGMKGRAVPSKEIIAMFAVDGTKANTVTANLKRLVNRGLVDKPGYGFFRAVMPEENDSPRARGPVSPVIPVTSDNYDNYEPPTRASTVIAGVQLCRVCGYALSDAVIASGENTHPSCDR